MSVNEHPDSETLRAFRDHRLSGPVVADIALHISACASCAVADPSAARDVLGAMAPRDTNEHLTQHLTDADLDAIVSGGPVDERISRHLAGCAMCRAEVEDLRSFAVRLSPPRPWQRWAIAAAVVLVVIGLSAISLLRRPASPGAIPVTASQEPVPVGPGTATQPAPRVVASLADGGGQIALLEDGTVAGIAVQSPRDAEDARAVLSGRTIAIPTFVAAMPGAVRGGSTSERPPRAIEPFRSGVLETRPRFSWTPVPNAQTYRVAVFDGDYEEIAQSAALTTTSWTPAQPLPADVDLSWHVVAETPAGEVSSAGSDRGEAVFRVLTAKEAAAVESGQAHYRDSHLFKGLLYSRHGLLHAAEREFRLLGEQNPGSPIAKTLIESVSR